MSQFEEVMARLQRRCMILGYALLSAAFAAFALPELFDVEAPQLLSVLRIALLASAIVLLVVWRVTSRALDKFTAYDTGKKLWG